MSYNPANSRIRLHIHQLRQDVRSSCASAMELADGMKCDGNRQYFERVARLNAAQSNSMHSSLIRLG